MHYNDTSLRADQDAAGPFYLVLMSVKNGYTRKRRAAIGQLETIITHR